MKLVFCLGLLAVVAATAIAAKTDIKKCLIEEHDLRLNVGETIKDPKKCGEISCGQNGSATFRYCGDPKPKSGCKLGGFVDPEAKYPDCCVRNLICGKN